MELSKFKTVEQLAAAVKTLLLEDMAVNKGWISSAWQKDPLRFGYSGPVYDSAGDTNLGAGSVTLDSSTVPSGEIWVITNVAVSYIGTITNVSLQIQAGHDSSNYVIAEFESITSGLFYDRQGFWVLDASDYMRLAITNATSGDDAYIRIIGYRVDIDQ